MKTHLWVVLICAGWTLSVNAADDVRTASRPNFLVILADDMGFSDLGCYGGEIATPQLDALAAGGLRFSQFYNTARCWPSRAVILTGYYAQQVGRDIHYHAQGHGALGKRPAWAHLVSALLRPLGYRCYHSGKWHLDGKPLENGFDRSYRLEDHNRLFTPQHHFLDDQPLPPVEPDEGYYATTFIADHAVACLQEHARDHAGQPFFHFLAFTSPHFPLQALQEDIARYRHRYEAGWDVLQAARAARSQELGITHHDCPPIERTLGPPYDFPENRDRLGPGEILLPLPWDDLTSDQRAFQAMKMAIHAAMVDRMDQSIGRVLDQLKAMGAFENTLILFASDNGASAEIMVRGDGHDPQALPGSAGSFLCLGPGFSSASNSPLRRHKVWVHEGGISTPLIVHWPAGIADRGAIRHSPGHFIDITPTLVELAGGQMPPAGSDEGAPPVPGKSLVPLFAHDGPARHSDLWWCHEDHRAIRVGDWKLVAAKGDPWELYDLSTDRGETHNLAADYPDRVRELEALWLQRAEEFRRCSP